MISSKTGAQNGSKKNKKNYGTIKNNKTILNNKAVFFELLQVKIWKMFI